MERLLPLIRKKQNGQPILSDTLEAIVLKRDVKKQPYVPPKTGKVVADEARTEVVKIGGDVENTTHVLGRYRVQFGVFRYLD